MLIRLVVDFDAPTATRTDPSVSVRRFHFHSPKKPGRGERVRYTKAGLTREPIPQWREVRRSLWRKRTSSGVSGQTTSGGARIAWTSRSPVIGKRPKHQSLPSLLVRLAITVASSIGSTGLGTCI